MDTKQLRYFSAVYERRNLSHAAQGCNVAQSAISHHLSNLEAELGVKLFERLPRGMEPTAAASRLYEHAQTILRGLKAAREDVVQMADELIGEIHVGLPFTVIEAIGVQLMQEMQAEHGRAKIIIHEALTSELIRQLLSGQHDLVLCYNPPANERLKLSFVHEEEMYCAGLPKFLGGSCDPIEFEDALALPQIMLRRGEASRSLSTQPRLLESLYESAVFELNSTNLVRKAVAAGIGVAVTSFVAMRDLVGAGTIVARPLTNPRVTRGLHVARLADRLPTRLMETVQSRTLRLIAAEVSSGRWPTVNSASNRVEAQSL